MKKGIDMRMFGPGVTVSECIKKTKEFGFQGVEIHLFPDKDGLIKLTDEEAEKIERISKECGVKISSLSASAALWASPPTSSDPEKREKAGKNISTLIKSAERLSVETIQVVPGGVVLPWTPDTEVVPYKFAYQRLYALLTDKVKEAEESNVIIGLEPVFWNKFLVSPIEFMDFLTKIDSKSLRCYFDIANVAEFFSPEDWVDILKDYLQMIHIKDYKRSAHGVSGFAIIYDGDLNWKGIMKSLVKCGYEGYLIAEIPTPTTSITPDIIKRTSHNMDTLLDMEVKDA